MLESTGVVMSMSYSSRSGRSSLPALALSLLTLLATASGLGAQAPAQQPQQPQNPPQAQADSGGPGADDGSVALPKKKEQPDDAAPPAPAEPKFENREGAPNYSLGVAVPGVTVDVGVVLERAYEVVP